MSVLAAYKAYENASSTLYLENGMWREFHIESRGSSEAHLQKVSVRENKDGEIYQVKRPGVGGRAATPRSRGLGPAAAPPAPAGLQKKMNTMVS